VLLARRKPGERQTCNPPNVEEVEKTWLKIDSVEKAPVKPLLTVGPRSGGVAGMTLRHDRPKAAVLPDQSGDAKVGRD
jgi:hypothetical protein